MKQNSKLLGYKVQEEDYFYLGNTTTRMPKGVMLSILEDTYDVTVYVSDNDDYAYVDLSGPDARTALVTSNEFGGIMIADQMGRNVALDKKEVKHLYKFLKELRNGN